MNRGTSSSIGYAIYCLRGAQVRREMQIGDMSRSFVQKRVNKHAWTVIGNAEKYWKGTIFVEGVVLWSLSIVL